MEKKKLVVLTGAGMSAESGISTFRDSNGLWEQYRVEDVATPEGFARDPKLVLDFYNQRRRELLNTKPNAGHIGLAQLESRYDVQIITQNRFLTIFMKFSFDVCIPNTWTSFSALHIKSPPIVNCSDLIGLPQL